MTLPAPQSYSPETFQPLTFHDAVPAFLSGDDTPRAYLERCLETIAAVEPQVMAFAHLNEDGARAAADASTARYRAGAPLSPIDGMPVGIKDLLETRDMPTEMGSAFYKGNRPGRDSALVQALRAAGATRLHAVNVLEDPEVRANLPRFSNWPTFPQLFIHGELIGGCDITLELHESGELARMIAEVQKA